MSNIDCWVSVVHEIHHLLGVLFCTQSMPQSAYVVDPCRCRITLYHSDTQILTRMVFRSDNINEIRTMVTGVGPVTPLHTDNMDAAQRGVLFQ